MGNVEKWVVLGVLALIVGILVVSLNVDDPLKKDHVVLEGTKAPLTANAAEPKADPSAKAAGAPASPQGKETDLGKSTTSAVLDSVVDTAAAPKTEPAALPIPAGSILKTTDGLQESFMTDAMFYTWKAGDTFPGLAQRFYGDPSRLATLKRLNEGRTDVQPGERVLVPVFDLDAVQGAAAPAAAPETSTKGVATKGTSTKGTAAPAVVSKSDAAHAVPASSATGARTHVVADGESLWKIAKQELGSGSRWNEIYEANRDVLPTPESVHTGQKLRIP
jgi:nucleoid-associated protein YgaU